MSKSFEVIESVCRPKSADRENEDAVVATPSFAAVIDGATSSGAGASDYHGVPGGVVARQACEVVLGRLAASATCSDFVIAASTEISRAARAAGLDPRVVIASAVVYSSARREVWQVGDALVNWAGLAPLVPKRVDQIAIAMRVAVLKARVLEGATIDELRHDDPGRAAILPLLERQFQFCNNLDAGDLAYGALSGIPTPEKLQLVRSVPEEVDEIVLHSDGYPLLGKNWQETAQILQQMLEDDPLCIGELAGTKAWAAGTDSFDDRSYLRVTV